MKTNKTLGSTLLIISGNIGAGCLGLPMVAASIGYANTIIWLSLIWLILLISSYMVLEVSLALPRFANHFHAMAKTTLGVWGKFFTWLVFLFLLYSIISAYIAGNSSLLAKMFSSLWNIHLPTWLTALVSTIILGTLIFWSTRTVDYAVRIFIGVKGPLLLLMLALLLPHIHFTQLWQQPSHQTIALFGIPILVTSLCYHVMIPSIISYLDTERSKLPWILFIGISVPFVIYILWITTAIGIIPSAGNHSFTTLAANHGSVGQLIINLNHFVHNQWVSYTIDGFANIAMTASFMGIGLSLFDFLREGTNRNNNRSGRLQAALLAFIPPLVFATVYPQGFMYALNYAGLCCIILTILMPPMMLFQFRKKGNLNSIFKLKGGLVVIGGTFAFGCLFTVIAVLVAFHLVNVPSLLQ